MSSTSSNTLINISPDGFLKKKILHPGTEGLEKPYDGDFCVIRYQLKYFKPPQQVIDSSMRSGSSKEVMTIQIGTGSILQCIEMVIKSMIPGEESQVFIDRRAVHELRDLINDHLELTIELKTVLDGAPIENLPLSINLGFDSVFATASQKKLEGNSVLNSKNFLRASELYTEGLQLLSSLTNLNPEEQIASKGLQVVLHLNLAAAFISLNSCNAAIEHANHALDLCEQGVPLPDNISNKSKAHFRLGQAYEKAQQYKAALWQYKRAYTTQTNSNLLAVIDRVQKLAAQEPVLNLN